MSDDEEWTDITDEFQLTASNLKVGVLIHDKTFTLHDGMTAVEMMHPQMDIGTTRAQTRQILSIDEYVTKGLLPWAECSPAELITVFDVQLAAFVNWFKGQSLAQTVFACVHMHSIERIADVRLKTLTLAMLKLTGMAEQAVREANVFDDDEFQLYNFGFAMGQTKTVTSVLNSLKTIEDDLQREQRENNEADWGGVLTRVRFIKAILTIVNILTSIDITEKLDDHRIHQSFQHATQLLKQLGEETRHQLTHTYEDNVTLPLGFEPLFNQHLLPPTFQREHKLLPSDDEVRDFWSVNLAELKQLTKMSHLRSFHQFIQFFRDLSNQKPSLLTRSIAFGLYLPPSRRVMGQFCMADTLEATLSETFGRKSFTDDPAIYQLLNRAAPVFWQIIQIYCFNQSRQREKLEFELESLASHMRESVNLLSKVDQNIDGDCYYAWLIYQCYRLMSDYLDLGFMMDLYSDYEWEYIMWYEAEIIYAGCVKSLGYFIQMQSQVKKGKKKQLINYEKELIVNKIKFVISRAYSLAIRQFVHHGFIKSPLELNDDIGDKSNLRYSHRFAPFMNLREPAYIPWDQYQSISSALVTTTSMETAIQLFNTAKQHIEEHLEHLPSSFEPVVKIIMKNIIVCKVLNSPVGKLKRLSIVEQTNHYPLFTLM